MKKLILILALIVAAPVVVQAEQKPKVETVEFQKPSKGRNHDRSFLGIGDGKPGVFGIGTGQNLSSRNYNRWIQKRREFKSFAKIMLPDGVGRKGGKK